MVQKVKNIIARPIIRAYIYTGILEFFVMLVYVLTFKLAASYWGEVGFGEYSLIRRTLTAVTAILILGLEIEIPRRMAYTAETHGTHGEKHADTYFVGGAMIVGVTTFVIIATLSIFAELFGLAFFGDELHTHLMLPLILIMVGLSLHVLCYAYFRGVVQIGRANLLHFVTYGLLPLIAFFIFGETLLAAMNALGILSIIFSTTVLFLILRNTKIDTTLRFSYAKTLLQFGILRVPGPLALAALFTLPATLTAHASGIIEAGYVAFGITALGIVGTMMVPISTVLLPNASKMIARGDHRELRFHILFLSTLSIGISLTFMLTVLIFGDFITTTFFESKSPTASGVIKVISLSALPYVFYISLRSVIDAARETAVNSRNLVISFLFFLAAWGTTNLLSLDLSILYLFVGSLYIMGILTLIEVLLVIGGQRPLQNLDASLLKTNTKSG